MQCNVGRCPKVGVPSIHWHQWKTREKQTNIGAKQCQDQGVEKNAAVGECWSWRKDYLWVLSEWDYSALQDEELRNPKIFQFDNSRTIPEQLPPVALTFECNDNNYNLYNQTLRFKSVDRRHVQIPTANMTLLYS